MTYSKNEILQYLQEEDVKFIRLAFCDVFGKRKNISIMPEELERAFRYGIAFDASAIPGFGEGQKSDLFLHPEPETIMALPWRPEHGKVVRMISGVSYPDGAPFRSDPRYVLKEAMAQAKAKGLVFYFGAEQEFYLSGWMRTATPPASPAIRRGIWISPPRTAVKTCAGRSV